MGRSVHVDGKDKGQILIYALSTCVWCKKTKNLLNKLGIAYDYIDVDLLDDGERSTVRSEVDKWNPEGGFPTLVFNNSKCVIGYNEDEIRDLVA